MRRPGGYRRRQHAQFAAEGRLTLPEVSRFYGIVVRMYYEDHPPPHFHVVYQAAEAVVRIDTLEVTRGRLPRLALALIREWAVAHRAELLQNWRRAEAGEPVLAIAPLE